MKRKRSGLLVESFLGGSLANVGLSVIRHDESWLVCRCLLVFLVTMSSRLFDVGVEDKGLEYPCGNIIYVIVFEVRFSFCVDCFVLLSKFGILVGLYFVRMVQRKQLYSIGYSIVCRMTNTGRPKNSVSSLSVGVKNWERWRV